MSTFLRHEACPNCGSSDALAVFDDGHKWCFSCNHYENGSPSISEYRNKFDTRKVGNKAFLPNDFDYGIPKEGLEWLQKYGIIQKEIINNRFGWSKEGIYLQNKNVRIAPMLVFPVYGEEGQLLMWQSRNFGKEGPKYITRGAKNVYHILGDSTKTDLIIFTEDLISAIKVSRIVPAMPLWGSFLSPETARIVSKRFTKACLWLDKDKAQEALKQAKNNSHVFEEGCFSFRTELDPKEYSTSDINNFLKDM